MALPRRQMRRALHTPNVRVSYNIQLSSPDARWPKYAKCPLCALQIRALKRSPRTLAPVVRASMSPPHAALTPRPNSRPAHARPRNTHLAPDIVQMSPNIAYAFALSILNLLLGSCTDVGPAAMAASAVPAFNTRTSSPSRIDCPRPRFPEPHRADVRTFYMYRRFSSVCGLQLLGAILVRVRAPAPRVDSQIHPRPPPRSTPHARTQANAAECRSPPDAGPQMRRLTPDAGCGPESTSGPLRDTDLKRIRLADPTMHGDSPCSSPSLKSVSARCMVVWNRDAHRILSIRHARENGRLAQLPPATPLQILPHLRDASTRASYRPRQWMPAPADGTSSADGDGEYRPRDPVRDVAT
ncbi:hypothetical protein C8R44DRAFT_891858 [Mycena epipterygia]|nr:hypothetical protein C8R44DRAFT_891858 [Mycena epipterygia]